MITLINCSVKTTKELGGARAPQGCLYLLAAAEEAGYKVNFRDYQLEKLEDFSDPLNFTKFISDDSDVVAISTMSNLMPLVLAGTKTFKKRHPEKTVVLGGIGPSGVARRLMEEFDHIDVVAVGEGEETFCELLSVFEGNRALKDVKGIYYRGKDGDVCATPARTRVKSLDQLPIPAYHLLDMSRYETVGIQTARGCPFPCTFCDVSAYWGRKVTYRSIPSVVRELDLIEKKYNFDKITILDDTFTIDSERVKDFCKAWIEHGLSIKWSVYCRVDLLSEELIDRMVEAGCYRTFLGIESGSNEVLKKIAKPINFDHLIRTVKNISRKCIVRCNLIWGFPFETMEDLKQTVQLLFYLKELECDVSIAMLSPLPLSTLYKSGRYGLVLHEDLQSSVVSSRFFQPSGELADGKPSTLVDMIRAHPDIFPGFYTFKDDLFEQKLDYLCSMGLEIERLARQ